MKHVLVISLAALVACGGGGGGGDERPAPTAPNNPANPGNPGNPPAPPQSASVEMRSTEEGGGLYGGGTYSHAFNPSQVMIARGGTVTWTNNSGFAHSVDFTTANAPADIGVIDSGSASRAFQTAGTFSYQCTQHSGMSGTIVVQ